MQRRTYVAWSQHGPCQYISYNSTPQGLLRIMMTLGSWS